MGPVWEANHVWVVAGGVAPGGIVVLREDARPLHDDLLSRGGLALAIACFVVGAGLMLAFEMPIARIAGVLLLTAWVVIGAFALASPGYLGHEDDPEG